MIYVLSGSDRVKIQSAITKILGGDYEIFDGAELKPQDIMNIFKGATLFSAERKILIKDITPAAKGKGTGDSGADDSVSAKPAEEKADLYEEMFKYIDTKHTVVIWETTLSRKKSYKDFIKSPKVQTKKYDAAKPADAGVVFEILDTAKFDGAAAVRKLERIKDDNDPYMFFGLLVSQVLKRKEKRVLIELSKLDMQMKTSTIEPWSLISSFLAQVSSL